MKKLFTMIMTLVFISVVFSGCGGNGSSTSSSAQDIASSALHNEQSSPSADEAVESMFGVIKSMADGQLEIELAEMPYISEEDANESDTAVAVMQPDGSTKYLDIEKLSAPNMLGETKTVTVTSDTKIIGFTGENGTTDDLKEGTVIFADMKVGDVTTVDTVQLMG